MKTCKIDITLNSDDFLAAINEFLKYTHTIHNESPEKVIFNLSGCTYITPQLIGGIVALNKSLKQKECVVEYLLPADSAYLDNINFPDGIDFSNSSPEFIKNKLMNFNTTNYLPILSFPTKQTETVIREKTISTFNSILKNQHPLERNVIQAIYYLIDELTQNVVDHSGTSRGMLFAQYIENKHCMDLCISDCGKGIYKGYLDSGKYTPENNTQALEFAVKGKSVKDLPDSRGFGLSTSRKMLVEGLGGMFFLLSGDTFFIEQPRKAETLGQLKGLDYQGCYLGLRIPLKANSNFDLYKFVE